LFLEPVNLRDVRMIERGQDLGFALEAVHPAGADAGKHLVAADATSWFERHLRRA